jgi:hypothetical protein
MSCQEDIAGKKGIGYSLLYCIEGELTTDLHPAAHRHFFVDKSSMLRYIPTPLTILFISLFNTLFARSWQGLNRIRVCLKREGAKAG